MAEIHGGDVYRNKIEYDFSVSLNPLGCPPKVRSAVTEAAGDICHYPDPGQESALRALADAYGLSPENFICGNGASELFTAIAGMVAPGTVLLPAPTFSGYEHAVGKLKNCRIRRHLLREEEDFALTDRALEDITTGIDLLFLCNPNNPTGRCIDRGLLDRILEKCRGCGVFVVLDECFIELSADVPGEPILEDNVVTVRAFTKLMAIPGVRLGYAIAQPGIIDKIRKQLPEWNLSVFAQKAAVAGCEVLNGDFVSRTKETVGREREYLARELSALGFKVYPSHANFILFRSDRQLRKPLLLKGILIRDCSSFTGLEKGYYRVAVSDHEGNEVLVRQLKEIVDS